MNNRRSASVGALPVEKKHFVSRNESASGVVLDVRCACQYFKCESLLPERGNPVESRPTSKQGFVSDIEHHHSDNLSARSFNMMGRSTEFDRISTASFGGRMHGIEGKGLIVRSISDATEQEMSGGMIAGHRGRQMSIGGMSSGSFGRRDPDAVSIRSGISLRRVSRSPSQADLFIADLNIPNAHAPGHSKRGSRGDIPKFNIVAATPTPTVGNLSPPDFSAVNDRNTWSNAPPKRWAEDNKENLADLQGRLLPQNKPIDLSRYQNEPDGVQNKVIEMDINELEPVVNIRDNIKIDRMSPPLQQNVPDLSPVVEDETRIEIQEFVPQADLRPIDEILADDKAQQNSEISNAQNIHYPRQPSSQTQSLQFSQLKRQHAQEREKSPDYSKKKFNQSFQRGSSPAPGGMRQMDRLSPTSKEYQHAETRHVMQYEPTSTITSSPRSASFSTPRSLPTSSFQRGVSPAPMSSLETQQPARSDMAMNFQRGSSALPAEMQQKNTQQQSSMHHMDISHSPQQRRSSPIPSSPQQAQARETSKSFQRAVTPVPANMQQMGPAHHSQSDEKVHESYTQRFKSMFHSKHSDNNDHAEHINNAKHTDHTNWLETPPQNNRRLSVVQLLHLDRGRSASPGRKLKPDHSPTPSRLMSVFKHKPDHPTAMSVVEGTHVANVSLRKPPEDKPHTIKVTETFSLKVDEMHQYSSQPPKSPSPVRTSRLYASSEHLGLMHDRISESIDFIGDRQEPFAPVILSSARSSQMQLLAGDRVNYMPQSQSDLSSSRRFDSHENIHPSPQTFTMGNKKLVSVPISLPDSYATEITSSEFIHEQLKDHPNFSQPLRTNLVKAPSDQRLAQSKLLQRKAYTSDRTQSQDRAMAERAFELDNLSLSTRSMTKTVSFSFGERTSRLDQHEKTFSTTTNYPSNNTNWPERTTFTRDHEYEPIGEPAIERPSQPNDEHLVSALKKETSPAPATTHDLPKFEISKPLSQSTSNEALSEAEKLKTVEDLQKDIEERYFHSAATTTDSRTDNDVPASQIDSSALEDLPSSPENRKRGFMASAQDRTRRMQAGLKSQAGKIKSKFRSPKKVPSGSPKAKDRKRFKAPEFSKIRMPEIKRPDLSGFKRPEFTKFNKPDMSKFKLPDKFSSLKLTRSKSFKESTDIEDTTVSGTTPESTSPPATAPPKKQRFDFSFGTYPRAFRKKKKPQEAESTLDEPSVIPSTETQPSAESTSTPQGDRGPGPVKSRWADKFSDVSYNDSEGSRYRRFGSELESSFDRESSMERRMKEVLDENAKEEAELAMLGVVEQKQFADYDMENRAIHEISKTREGEFKRRAIVHQDSDLISEEGRDIGWTEREALKNQLLRKAELEAEAHLRYMTEMASNLDTQSSTSSKKLIFEHVDPNQSYHDPEMEESFENSTNGLHLGDPGSLNGSSIDRIEFAYVPPPKPRRLSHQHRHPHYDSENASQVEEFADDISLSQAGSDYYRSAPPSRPLRKSRSKLSQEVSIGGTPSVQYDDEDVDQILPYRYEMEKENILRARHTDSPMQPPQPPRRRRKQLRDSLEKDSYVNGFGGRSVSNSYLREDNKPEEVIVYRTEHEYKIPLATPESYTDRSVPPRKARSLSRLGTDGNDHGADSINLELAIQNEIDNANLDEEELQEKYIIEMMENDGYAVVRKENLPKPTPPARRKKFSRSPGERFATMPHLRKESPAIVEQISSSKEYSTIGRPTPPRRKSAQSLGAVPQKELGSADFTDYEVPEFDDRTESPRNLQSGDIINKMKYRPLPAPPRPPREKRHIQRDRHGDGDDEFDSRDDQDDRYDHDDGAEKMVFEDYNEQSSDDYNLQANIDRSIEVEVSTQTDPLPDDFVCEEFEITDDMKIIEPTRAKTLDEILKEEEEADLEQARQAHDEILLRGIQRFREANQRSLSEKSRASSQAKSLSRPQTPSAILIEKRIPTPVPNSNGQTVLEASLTVQPIDDLDLEEELLRREGLYDGSQSKSDGESRYRDDEEVAHGSDEENARVGEEEQSYTHSTDAESQRHEEEELEQRLLEQILEANRLKEEEEEEQRLLEELDREQQLLEEIQQLHRLQEEEEEINRRFREEEQQKQVQHDEEEKEIRLSPDLNIDENDGISNKDDSRLAEDSSELRSDVSADQEYTSSPPISPLPPPVEDQITAILEKALLSARESLERNQKDELEEEPTSSAPMAPPRKRSATNVITEDQIEALPVSQQQASTAPVPITGVMPSHLALADLEVERLRVHALQAGQIMVSHLHGAQIQADELACRSANLVVNNIELPPGFIEDIVERVRTTERDHVQAGTQTFSDEKTQTEEDSIPPPPIPTRQPDVPPVRPPPPQREYVFSTEYVHMAPTAPYIQLHEQTEAPVLSRGVLPTDYLPSVPPMGFYSPRMPDNDAEPIQPVYRRRRHHRRRDSSSEEDHQRRRSRSARPEPQTVGQASRQLISACSLPLVNAINQLTNTVRPTNNENTQDQVQPRSIPAVVVLFIVITLGLLIYLLSGKNIHHHHWDYFNPPGNDGRLS